MPKRKTEERNAIEQTIRGRIDNGSWPLGMALPGEPTLAREFGVARETLRSIMRPLLDEGLLVRIPRQGTFVKTAASRHGETLVFLLPYPDFLLQPPLVERLHTAELLCGVLRQARREDCNVVTLPISDTNNPADINLQYLQSVRTGEKVLFQSHWYAPLFPLLERRRCRVGCCLGGARDLSPRLDACLAAWTRAELDTEQSFFNAAAYLANRGCRSVALALYDLDSPTYFARQGYRRAAETFHFPPVELLLRHDIKSTPQAATQIQHFAAAHPELDGLVINVPPYFGTVPATASTLNRHLGLPEKLQIVCLKPEPFFSHFAAPTPCLRFPFQQIGEELTGTLLRGGENTTRWYPATIQLFHHGEYEK